MNNQSVVTAVEDFLKLHKCSAAQLLVAYSGGPDSTALLWALAELRSSAELGSSAEPPSLAEPLHACWIDHGIRPADELENEEAYVRAVAGRLGVTLHVRRAERGSLEARAAQLGSVEAAARHFRYEALRSVKETLGLRLIVTGHHADDQWETQVMRFFTGSGIAGLQGMRAAYHDVARPLLRLRRAQLESYVQARALPLNQDSTNAASDYLRNKLRHELMPVVARVFPGYGTSLDALAQKMRDDDSALEAYAAELFPVGGPQQGLRLARYLGSPRAVRHRALFAIADAALKALPSGAELPGQRVPWRLIVDIDRKLERATEQSAHVELARWHELCFSLESGHIRARPASKGAESGGPSGFCVILQAPGTFRIGKGAVCTVYYSDDGADLRLDAFSWPLVLRTRKPGDRIRNAVGWKALDKLLAESGPKPEARDFIPVLEDGSGIVALLGSALGYRDIYRYNAELSTRASPGYLGIDMKGIAEDYAIRR